MTGAEDGPEEDSGPVRRIRVLLVDDDPLVRAGLTMILGSAEDITVVGEVGDGVHALAAARRHRPDVVLMDIRMPELDGIQATALLRGLDTPPEVLVLTTFQLDKHVFGALEAGASGYLLKDTRPEDIVRAVRSVDAGDAMLSPGITRTLVDRYGAESPGPGPSRRQRAQERLAALSEREREVAVEVGKGSSNGDIAGRLYLSEATVKAHVSRLLSKLGVANRVGVAILVHDADLS